MVRNYLDVYRITYILNGIPKEMVKMARGNIQIFAGFILLIAFVMHESKVENPVFEINLLRKNFTFSLSSLAALLNYSATFVVVFILRFYLQFERVTN